MTESTQQTTSNRETVARYIDVGFGDEPIDAIDDLVAVDYVDHMKGLEGREALKEHLRERQGAAGGGGVSADLLLASDDHVAVHWVVSDDDGGEPAPMGMELYRLSDGRIAECWTYWADRE